MKYQERLHRCRKCAAEAVITTVSLLGEPTWHSVQCGNPACTARTGEYRKLRDAICEWQYEMREQ